MSEPLGKADRSGGLLGRTRAMAAGIAHALDLAWRAAPVATSLYVVVSIVQGVLPAALALAMKWLIDGLQYAGARESVPEPVLAPLGAAVSLGVLTAVSAVLPVVSDYLKSRLQRGVRLLVEHRLYSAVSCFQGLVRFETPAFLDRLRMAQQAATTTPEQIVSSCFGLLQTALTVTGFLGVLAAISPVMALVTVMSVLPLLFVQMSLSRRQSDLMWEMSPRSRRQLFYQRLLFDLDAVKETRLFGTGAFLLGRMTDETRAINRAEDQLDRRVVARHVPLSALSASVAVGGLIWMVLAAADGRFSIGDIAAFMAATAGVQGALGAAVADVTAAYSSLLLFGHYLDVIRAQPDLPVNAHPRAMPVLRDGIRLEDVWFRYTDDGPWVLRGVTMTIPAGGSLGLVGLNGAGKSTLVKLLCRLYDPARGRITWDGVDLRDVDVTALRDRVSAVFQDFTRYDLTAGENIGLGDLRHLDDGDRIRDAARQAGIDAHLDGLPRGYRTMLSRIFHQEGDAGELEQGVTLSGGQWQRVALARAFLRTGRDLLVLDEPSSGLDAAAERELHDRLYAYRAGTTSVLISHRLGGVRRADRIVVLREGRVAEEGTHEELVELDGEYARLYRMQANDYAESQKT